MSAQSKVQKSFFNVVTGIFGQGLSYVLSFVIRTVFIKTLGELYLGLNGLFTNILSVLNLAELGLGTAIVIELYKTVAQNDQEKSKQFLQLYKKAYYIIGSLILAAGLILTPFLHLLIKDHESLDLINYRLVFILYLLNTVFSYFFYADRQSILNADQAEYKARIITYIFKFAEMLLQIVTLFVFQNIYLYLIIPIVLTCTSTVLKGRLIGKWYPFVKEKPQGKLSKEETKETWKNVGSVALYKVSGVVINSTDNILLSSFISIIVTGLYSNYLIIVAAIKTMLEKCFSAFTASLGHLNVEEGENTERKYFIFKTISFMNFWFYGFCGVCMLVLFKPFITFWIGEEYVFDTWTEIAIVANFLVFGLQETMGTHRAAYGLFQKGKWRPLFTVVLNIVLSILFIKIMPAQYGVVAVLLGTILSNLLVAWWFDALIVHKYAFQKSPKKYYLVYWLRMAYIAAFCVLLKWICSLFSILPLVDFLAYGVICTVVYNVAFLLIFWETKEFEYLKQAALRLLKRRK